MEFDASRAILSKKEKFKKLTVKDTDLVKNLVKESKMNENEELLVLERNGHRLAFRVYHMAYHHVAQGALAGQPYLVNF
jgi:transcription antitermination factor NusA-like protein